MRELNMKPFSENIIFFDTEFSTNDRKTSELLSIAMVKFGGEQLYIELEYNGKVSDWVKENVLPSLKQKKVSKQKAVQLIKEFIGENKPYLVSYVNVFDMVYFYDLFGLIDDTPIAWPPIDFASLMFALGINPEEYGDFKAVRKNTIFNKLKIDLSDYQLHNALDDARLLQKVYLELIKS